MNPFEGEALSCGLESRRFTLRGHSLVLVAAPFVLLACSAPPSGVDLAASENAEVWSPADNPAIFSENLERSLDALPMAGDAAVIPWAGSYWPTYQDNINYRWAGANTDSPAMKYQKAFGGTGVEDAVSLYQGIDSQPDAKACTTNRECDVSLGQTCAKRNGRGSGKCIATWFGICHAWAPAAILVPEPQKEVVRNGVTFKVQDIKALVTLAHNHTTSKFVSLRCDLNNSEGQITYDEYGRPSDPDRACIDTNPGTYHILLANYLGLQKKSFVEDRTFDAEVWNQPIRGYKIVSKQVVTPAEANRLVGVKSVGGTTVKRTGAVVRDAWSDQGSFAVTAGSTYRVIMTGTNDADVYVHFGSPPTASTYTCRPYLNSSNETCAGAVPAGATQMFVSVSGYAAASRFRLDIATGGTTPTGYVFNANAAGLVHVTSEVTYISEASASTDGNLSGSINTYTRTDAYDYILELDGAGKIIGGEWVGSSKKSHPDFVWLPTGVSGTSVAGGKIAYAQVMSILKESIPTSAASAFTKNATVDSL